MVRNREENVGGVMISPYIAVAIALIVLALPFALIFFVVRSIREKRKRVALALQLRFLLTSESMSFHDSEVMDDRCIDRGDAGTLGVFAA
jgi:hypothetical protein